MLVRMLAAILVGVASAALAQAPAAGPPGYPSRPVRFVVPLPPGGSPDTHPTIAHLQQAAQPL